MNFGSIGRVDEAVHNVTDHTGQDEHLFSARASRSTLPPIDTGRVTPLRLQPSEDDINSPATPDPEDMEPYLSVATLPPPTLVGNVAHFGSVHVPLNQARAYHAVRIHAVEAGNAPGVTNGDKGRKYVAYLETRDEPTEVHPHPPGAQTITTLKGRYQLPALQGTKVHPDRDRALVQFGTHQGMFTESGETQSAATGGVHELGHAARMYRDRTLARQLNVDPNQMFDPQGEPLPG
jgi:hypothetical protein